MSLPDPEEQPTLSLWPEAGKALGISRNTAYAEARRYLDTNGAAGIPVLVFGSNRYRVPTAALRRLVGLDVDTDPDTIPHLSLVDGGAGR